MPKKFPTGDVGFSPFHRCSPDDLLHLSVALTPSQKLSPLYLLPLSIEFMEYSFGEVPENILCTLLHPFARQAFHQRYIYLFFLNATIARLNILLP